MTDTKRKPILADLEILAGKIEAYVIILNMATAGEEQTCASKEQVADAWGWVFAELEGMAMTMREQVSALLEDQRRQQFAAA